MRKGARPAHPAGRHGGAAATGRGQPAFVVAYAKRYRHSRVSLLDLINEGNIGLIQAAKKFDPERNVKFITYAVWWIRQAILHALSEHGASFRCRRSRPTSSTGSSARAKRSVVSWNATRAKRNWPTSWHAPEDVRVLLASNQNILSLNEPVDEEGEAEFGDLLQQYVVPDTDEEMVRRSFEETLREALAGFPRRSVRSSRCASGSRTTSR